MEMDREGQKEKQGNNGEDIELTGTAPECPTSHKTSFEMLTSQSMAQTAWLNPVLSGGAIHLSMMRGHYSERGRGVAPGKEEELGKSLQSTSHCVFSSNIMH